MWKSAVASALLVTTVLAAERRAFPDASERILVFADQLPNTVTPAQRKFIASHFVGGQKQTRSWVRETRRLNPDFLMLHYQLAVGTGPALFVVGDQWVSDMEEVQRHTSWFLHSRKGHRLRQKDWNWYVMDIRLGNGFPKYWLQSALDRMRASESDGVFADSYTQDILMLQLDPADEPWFTDVELCKKNWLPHLNRYGEFIAKAFADTPEKFYFLPNLGGLTSAWDDVTRFNVGDGGMIEGFAIPEKGKHLSLDDWKLQMLRILLLASRNKILICQTYIDAADMDARWFVVCSHLLSKGRYSYLHMFEKSSLEWYPEYELKLGGFEGEVKSDVMGYWDPATRTFRRKFAEGEVLVNPGSEAAAVKFSQAVRVVIAAGGGAVDAEVKWVGALREEAMQTVDVPAHSGRVVLW